MRSSLEPESDAESAVYHDCVEAIDDEPAIGTTISPHDDVESYPLNDNRPSIADHPRTMMTTTTTHRSIAPTTGTAGGSSLPAAIFNFTNSIVGAGCIGLGGAIAVSGGFISIGLVLFFGLLTKLSLDMLIRLSLEQALVTDATTSHHQEHSHQRTKLSYEDLAQLGMGWSGRIVVMLSKFFYSFGCLVAYVIVIKDNLGPALKSLIYENNENHDNHTNHDDPSRLEYWLYHILSENVLFTWVVSATLILPLCMLRDMTPLAFTSLVSVASMVLIVAIVIYIYFDCSEVREEGGTFYENWLEIRPGIWNNLGTFVFTFVSHHTVHLVFASLKPPLQTLKNWKFVSASSLLSATTVSLSVGVFVYATFWQNTKSNIFQLYPANWMINSAKILLCITMIGTFPLPFFTCRELFVVTVIHPLCGIDLTRNSDSNNDDLEQPLLEDEFMGTNDVNNTSTAISDVSSVGTELSRRILHGVTPKNWLLPDDDRQLQWLGHVGVTFKLWLVATGLAIAAPNLGDILNLVGCASGTLIAFIIPAILSFRLEGYTNLALLIVVVGGVVGIFGTYCSVQQLVRDIRG